MTALVVNPDGWIATARHVTSPNFDARPSGSLVDLLVIHAIALPPGQFNGDGIERLFTNRCVPSVHPCFAELQHVRVSAHFLIRRDGELLQFVGGHQRAWHAGVSHWQGRERCNDFSLGVELEGGDAWPFEPAQYDALNRLIAALEQAWPLRHIVGHCDIAPGRKTDPGPLFDWHKVQSTAATLRSALSPSCGL